MLEYAWRMNNSRHQVLLSGAMLLLNGSIAFQAEAGGSGLNTVVIFNQQSSNSCALANYFCERRRVPPENVLRISWSGTNTSWTSNEFHANLLGPLLDMLAARQLTNQIDYVVLSMDIPFQTRSGATINSTTSALFYGLKPDGGTSWKGVTNSYAGSEASFRQAKPASAPGHSFLTSMMTAGSLEQAKHSVDQGVNSDGTLPAQPVILAKSFDLLRSVRHGRFDNAIFNTRLRGDYSMLRTNADSPWGQTNLLGYQTGLANFSISPNTFVAGAMADSMTSYGGIIFGPNSQTTLLAFIHAGAAGSYGTVTEPFADPQKFPDPEVYFYQARGFSLAECYYQSLSTPYLGLIVGEPLAAPFQQPGTGEWLGVSSNAVLSGAPQLSLRFQSRDRNHPLQQIDLFVDGKYFRTLTNVPPCPGNLLSVTLNGYPVTYAVPTNASLATVATGLAAQLNASATTNATRVVASVHGDRIELQAVNATRPEPPTSLQMLSPPGFSPGDNQAAPSQMLPASADRSLGRVSVMWPAGRQIETLVSNSTGGAEMLSTYLAASRRTFLDSEACGIRPFSVNGSIQIGTWLQVAMTKTNGVRYSLAVTNESSSARIADLAQQLITLINATADWQGDDGTIAEDLATSALGAALFHLRARSPGLEAAAVQVQLAGSGTLQIDPRAAVRLDANAADLQLRNHLYVTAGLTNLALSFSLDTTALAEGYHELTAVAYEGSHVRTQTRAACPVIIQNTSLSANLTLLDLPDTAPVQGSYHIQVTASTTNEVSAIALYSTGGVLDTVTNQSAAAFQVEGARLGVGLHPFYALVQDSSGSSYRTETKWGRLISGL